jgi:hypothetical protein
MMTSALLKIPASITNVKTLALLVILVLNKRNVKFTIINLPVSRV